MAEPKIPEFITVHIGAPDDDGENISVLYSDYLKNVASSEIYPTWPREALKANILAEASVALNRVYTGFYRNRGYNFDITSSPAYDQTFIKDRDIFENISLLVDSIFNSYIRRSGNIEPLFAEFCDGVEVMCDGLYQWGSVELANEGLTSTEILERYYGDDIEIVTNVPIDAIGYPLPPSLDLREGDSGSNVELMQIRLNRISRNYPGIPKIPTVDGFFDKSTTNSVRRFQETFNLNVDGIIGSATWNRINAIYTAVKRLQQINSEGLKLEELDTSYESQLQLGDKSDSVYILQYYLAYISLFDNRIVKLNPDGDFGSTTLESVKSYQAAYNLAPDGIVGELTWNSIENTYYLILRSLPYQYEEGVILPYPGRVLRVGIDGNDVMALQSYLSYISRFYPDLEAPDINGVYDEKTEKSVTQFKELFDVPGNKTRVNAITWNAIASVYDDLYEGAMVNDNQFPGYNIS